jgi:glucose/arabinose dehydrogenase/chitodextrinase
LRRLARSLLVLLGALPTWAAAATLPTGFVETLVTNGLTNPTAMALAPDGRLFVSEQAGTLRVIKNDTLLAAPFVTFAVDSTGQRGLLGVALDPDFASNQFVYAYHTTSTAPTHNRIVRFTANGDVALAGSMVVILDLDNVNATSHNGGGLHFGPDGKLYASSGENSNPANAQTLANLFGKILRLNPDGTIPTDNPFFATATGLNRAIWALGLRNPVTVAFQPGTGRVFIHDVGDDGVSAWEEINDGVAGANYGWPQTEGPNPPGSPGVTYPIVSYAHNVGTCGITGGAFYNPPSSTFPADYQGKYLFSDYCGGVIRRLNPVDGTDTGFATDIVGPIALQVAANGDLYYLSWGDGLLRVRNTVNQPPVANSQSVTTNENTAKAITLTGSDPENGALTFTVLTQPAHGVLSGTAPNLTYTPATNYSGPDSFTFQVSDPSTLSSAPATVSITVTAVNQPPVASFTVTPPSGSAPLPVSVDASASVDPDGTIASYAWDFGDGTTGTGVTASHTYANAGSYTVTLTVTDDKGATAVATRPILVRPAGAETGRYYTVTPCRLLDTREANGPAGGPALSAGLIRTLQIVGSCGVPANAMAVLLNATVIAPTAPGYIQIFPTGSPLPPSSALNFVAGQTRGNNGVYALGDGQLDFFLGQASGTADAAVDIAGYFVK